KTMRLTWALFLRPAPATKTPALTSSSVNSASGRQAGSSRRYQGGRALEGVRLRPLRRPRVRREADSVQESRPSRIAVQRPEVEIRQQAVHGAMLRNDRIQCGERSIDVA